MATAMISPTAAHRASAAVRIVSTLARSLGDALMRHRRIARIEAELRALSDRDLADLGIVRCDIGRIARSALTVH